MKYLQQVSIRITDPPKTRLTDRDKRILETIHAFDGLMSLRQIDRLFFSGKGGTWPRERMRTLVDNGYVAMPDTADLHRVPRGEVIYFLGAKGAQVVAGLHGELAKDFPWRRKPRWSLIAHDLAVSDFRINLLQATWVNTSFTLNQWISETEFWAHPDRIEYRTAGGVKRKRKVIPDGFFTIRQPSTGRPGMYQELAFLLEIDMGTEDNPRFAREKVRPGVAYLASQAYRERFGIDYGPWLVVTTSEKRMANMMAQTKIAGGVGQFYFTTFDRVSAETVLTRPIWKLVGSDEPTCITP